MIAIVSEQKALQKWYTTIKLLDKYDIILLLGWEHTQDTTVKYVILKGPL